VGLKPAKGFFPWIGKRTQGTQENGPQRAPSSFFKRPPKILTTRAKGPSPWEKAPLVTGGKALTAQGSKGGYWRPQLYPKFEGCHLGYPPGRVRNFGVHGVKGKNLVGVVINQNPLLVTQLHPFNPLWENLRGCNSETNVKYHFSPGGLYPHHRCTGVTPFVGNVSPGSWSVSTCVGSATLDITTHIRRAWFNNGASLFIHLSTRGVIGSPTQLVHRGPHPQTRSAHSGLRWPSAVSTHSSEAGPTHAPLEKMGAAHGEFSANPGR